MLLWLTAVLTVLFLLVVPASAQKDDGDTQAVAGDEATNHDALPTPLIITGRDSYLRQAYRDVFVIVSQRNQCSEFFGDPRATTTVLNEMISRVKRHALPREVSFRMNGRPQLIYDVPTGAAYRIFDSAFVNFNGSFYQRRVGVTQKLPQDIGFFSAGSRAARALILLHELGHLIRGSNGAWLIPDDGNDGWQSRQNTARIQRSCFRQLTPLN